MKLFKFLSIALAAAVSPALHAQQDARQTLEWLRVLAIDARIDYELAGGDAEPDLFFATSDDGRTLIAFIAETLGAGGGANWPLIDEGVTACFAEADRLKTAAEAAEDPSLARTALNEARKRFLNAAALLLDAYRGASQEVFDEHALGLDAIPDWALPGDINIKEAAGSARINVRTKEFGGRLSGEIGLPKFDAEFAVPNASFDSRGNVDLTAYGSASFPPESPDKVTLSIPERRPLVFHLSESGEFRAAGSGRVKLPDGNQFEAHFDADYPMYEFGLSYRGNFTLELAKEVTLLRPTIDLEPAFSLEAIDGLGQFFGSLGKGYESFMEDAPELPSDEAFNIGVEPEFADPQVAVPFDVMDAWLVGLFNDEVRPLVNAPLEDSLDEVRKWLGSARANAREAQSGLAGELNRMKRLRREADKIGRLGEVIKESRQHFDAGDQAESDELLAQAAAIALEIESAARANLEALPSDASLEETGATIELWVRADRIASSLTTEAYESLASSKRAVAISKAGSSMDAELASYGLNTSGAVTDAAKLASASYIDLEYLMMVSAAVDRMRQTLWDSSLPEIDLWIDGGVVAKIAREVFDRARADHERAIADDDPGERHLAALRLVESAQTLALFNQPLSSEEAEFSLRAMDEAREAVAPFPDLGTPPRPEQWKLAVALGEAATNHREVEQGIARRRAEAVLSATGDIKTLNGPVEGYSFGTAPKRGLIARQYFALKAGIEAGAVGDILSGDLDLRLGELMRFYAQVQTEKYSDGEQVIANLSDAYTAVLTLLDLVALAEELLPSDAELIGELQTSWQALHLTFIGVAEARRAHWYLSEYSREIAAAAGRYGEGVGAALEGAFEEAGNEALAGLSRVVDYLAGVVDGFSLTDFDLSLPGDLQVQRAFGVLRFDVTELPPTWDFEFGGQLYFADYDFTLGIPSAHLFSDGMFDVSLMTEGPVPFGFEETMQLETAFSMTGNVLTPSIDSASAGGTLIYTPEGGGAPEVFTGSLDYAFAEETGHRFEFETTFNAGRNLFTEEVAVFDGGFGFALQLDPSGAPQQGNVSAEIGMGFLLREGADVTSLDEGDYWLNFDGSAEVNFSVVDSTADFRLLSGTLTLPPDIFSNEDASAPATIALESVVCVRVDFANQTISWCDEGGQTVLLSANNIHAAIPGLEGADLEITTGKLRLSGTELPVIEQLDAALTLPLPGGDEATVNIDVEHWPIDGLPQAVAITLEDPLTLLDLDGIAIQVKAGEGVEYGGCPAGISFAHDSGSGMTTLQIASAMAVDIDPDMLWDAGEDAAIGTEVSGCFTWEIGQLPSFVLDDVTISGRFRIGGANGVELLGARGASAAEITFANINNIFQRPPADPADAFRVDLEGAVNFSDIIQFELLGSSFIWDGTQAIPLTDPPVISDLIPRFEPGGLCVVAGEEGIELVEGLLPLYPTELCLRFNDGSLPVFPAPGQMGLFDPLNIQVLASGVVTLPNGSAVEGGSPGISGGVTNVEIQFQEIGGFPVPDFVRTMTSIDSLTLQIENLDIPPLGGITGGLHLGNLNAVAAGNFEELFFAGNLGAKVNSIGASVLLAARPTEFVGACFSLSAGPAGIPLGPSGFLITGASGGINFKNDFSDPCDFASYITIGANNVPTGAELPQPGDPERPVGSSPPDVDELGDTIADDLAANPVNTNPDIPAAPDCVLPTSPDFNCIQGPFPPPSINPLCEKITVGGEERIIFKGTSLDASQVDQLLALAGLTPADLDGMTPGEVIDDFVEQIVGRVEGVANQVLSGDFDLNPANGLEFDPDTVDPRAYQFFSEKIGEIFNSVDDAAKNALREGFNKALDADPDASLYQILLAKAAEGIPCFDVTLRVEGTLSHAAVSTVLSGTGAVTLSSTGTAVLDGSINLVGIPVGDATLALSLTNENGNIDPSFGGVAEVALGPLELGRMTMSLSCPGCYDAVSDAIEQWVAINAVAFGADVEDFLIQMMDCADPRRDALGVLVPRSLAVPLDEHFLDPEFGVEQRVAWMASFLNIFQVAVDNARKVALGQEPAPLPVPVTAQTLESFLGSFTTLITRILVDVNPRICFGGDVGPKIFGFPLTGGGTAFGGGMLYQRVTDPATMVDYQELVAQMQFSPAQTLSSVLLGASAYALPTAIDQAQMGYSLRMPAFTDDNVALMLTDPLQFAGNQLETLIEDSVFSFGYQLQPLGYKLADGQGRVIMPRLGGHPSRGASRYMRDPADPSNTIPIGAWTNPDDLGDPLIPTRMEIILAALSKGQLQNPLWRGSSQDLQSLFALPSSPCYQPSNGGCDLLTAQVAGRVDPAAFAGMDLANHYFPDGGFIGGAELALPNVIAKPAPIDRLNQLFTVPNAQNFGDWAANAGILFGDPGATEDPNFDDPGYAYFTGTTCSGQMAMYLPFPGPPAGFDFDNASLEEFVSTISSLDMSGLADRTLPSFPHERILLSGWLDAPVMGMPVAQGSVDYNPARQCFSLMAEIPETWDHDDNPATAEVDSWLAKFVTGEVEIEIKGADYMADPATPPTGGMIERLAAIGENLDPSNAAAIISDIQSTMPKASMEATAGVQIPAELEPFIRASGGASLSVFAFSPEFEPAFEPANSTPYAVARRRGGFGLAGTFDVGYWPALGDPFVIDGLAGSLAITPDSEVGLFPGVAGSLMVDAVDVPGFPRIRNAEFSFNSSPDNLAPYTLLEGQVEPIVFSVPGTAIDLLRIRPVRGRDLEASVAVRRDDSAGAPTISTAIKPAIADMPFLGQDVAISVYGETPDDDFTFTTTPREEWRATVCLTGPGGRGTPPTFVVRDPANPVSGANLLEFTPNAPVCGTLTGTGLQAFSIKLDIPRGMLVTAFKGQPTEASVQLGAAAGFYTMYIDHLGRCFIDFGEELGVELPGAFSAGGHVVFGLNTTGSDPALDFGAASLNFQATEVFESRSRRLNVSNLGLAPATIQAQVVGGGAGDFTVDDPIFVLDPGQNHDITVLFHPETAGGKSATLRLTTNDPNNLQRDFGLSGTATATPKYFQSRDSVPLGFTVVGGTSTGTITIGNSGHARLFFSSATLSGGTQGFSVDPPLATASLAPGQSRTHVVSFSPLSLGAKSGAIVINTVGQGSYTVPLSGTGSESRWITIRDPEVSGRSSDLNDIEMLTASSGWAVGDDGVVLQTTNGGHSWISRTFASFDMHDIAVERTVINNTRLASYHFEDPPDSSTFRDSSGNGLHATTADKPKIADTSSAIPLVTGSWASFLGSGQNYIDFPGLELPTAFSIHFWINPSSTANGQCFVGKNTAGGGNEFLFGIWGNNYRINALGQNWDVTGATRTTGWQHWEIYSDYQSGSNTTRVWLRKDNVSVGQRNFPGRLTFAPGGKPWTLGNEWDGGSRSDFFTGGIDEVYFHAGILSDSERSLLLRGGQRLAIAGHGGQVFNSYNGGTKWSQLPGFEVTGWRQNFRRYDGHDWFGAGFDGSGMLYLAGRKSGNQRVLLREQAGVPGEPNDFFDATFSQTGASGEYLTSAFTTPSDFYATSSAGYVYRADTFTSNWVRHGSRISGGAWDGTRNTLSSDANDYTVVGAGGNVLNSDSGNTPILVNPPNISTTLRAIDNDGGEFYAVGDGGLYARSLNRGVDWDVTADGLGGNNRGISVVGTSPTFVRTWVAGEDQTIQFRPNDIEGASAPFLVFEPGELDFGFLLRGRSKTLPLRLYNRGRSPLEVTSLNVTGTGFSLVQGEIDEIAPGDWMTLLVRYKPLVDSEQDLGALVISTPGEQFEVPLRGSSDNARWSPYVFRWVGEAIDGEVADVVFTSFQRGYALVKTDSGSDRLFRTANSGASWSNISLPSLPAGQTYDLYGLDAVGSGNNSDDVYLCGRVPGVRGVVLYSTNAGPVMVDRSPADDRFNFTDVKALSTGSSSRVVVVSEDSGGRGDVWRSENAGSTWDNHQNQPGDPFSGDLVGLIPSSSGIDGFAPIFTVDGSKLYSTLWDNNWFQLPGKQTHPDQPIRSFQFIDDPLLNYGVDYGWMVGDKGLFWRIAPAAGPPDWIPADNAELFGVTDLGGVSFAGSGGNFSGWVVGGSKIFRSINGGQTWGLSMDAGDGVEMGCVSAPTTGTGFAGGRVGGKAVVWKFGSATAAAAPVLSVDDVVLLGETDPGGELSASISLQNIGNAALDVHELALDSSDPLSRFELAGSLPTSIPAGGTRTVTVRFNAAPEPAFAEIFGADAFYRFEQARGASTFYNEVGGAAPATASTTAGRAPQIVKEGLARDRCLQFDGGDYAEFDGPDRLDGDFSIACWVNVESTSNHKAFFGKHSVTGGTNFVLGGIYNGRYTFRIRGVDHQAVTATTGWQHIAVTCERMGSETLVRFYKNGVEIWNSAAAGKTFPVAGNVAGKKWVLGADWDGTTNIGDYFRGCMDDFLLVQRLLAPSDVAKLMAKSPLPGLHRATLSVRSDADVAAREIDLRAEVADKTEMVVFDSELPGQTITVDGVEYATPVAFAVGSAATSPREWAVGSMHEVTVPAGVTVTNADGDEVNYVLDNAGGAGAGTTKTFCAEFGMGGFTAEYGVSELDDGDDPPPAAAPNANHQSLIEAMAGTPAGSFFRLSDGEVSVPQVGNLQLEGSLFVSLTEMNATLDSSPVTLPDAAHPWLELGGSFWELDYLVGSHFRLAAQPPSVQLLGNDLGPDVSMAFEYDLAGGDDWDLEFELEDDFKPFPGYLEFKQGMAEIGFDGANYNLAFDGGIRVLRLPDIAGGGGQPGWVYDEDVNVSFSGPDIDFSLRSALNLPTTFASAGPLQLRFANSGADIYFRFNLAEGATFGFRDVDLRAFNTRVIPAADAEVGSSGVLSVGADVSNIWLTGNFSLQPQSGSTAPVEFEIAAGIVPTMRFIVPPMSLHSSMAGFPSGGLDIPGVEIDTGGAFDSGKVALPNFTFNGIGLSAPSNADIDDHHIRFRRTASGDFKFDVRAEVPFPFVEPAKFSLSSTNFTVDASITSDFGVFDDPLSLEYDSSATPPFSGGNDQFTVYYGTSGGGVESGGYCIIGVCP